MGLIIANWKMNLELNEAKKLCLKLSKLNNINNLIITPPVPYLAYLTDKFPALNFASGDISAYYGFGSYTGEFSGLMLKSCNVKYVICGHAERRNLLKEDSVVIKQKFDNIINSGMIPILCIGEDKKLEMHKGHKDIILKSLKAIISKSSIHKINKIIVAYEPAWSIGTGMNASIEDLQEIFRCIKDYLKGAGIENNSKLVYGGSVTADNFKQITAVENIDGVLVGAASLVFENLKQLLS